MIDDDEKETVYNHEHFFGVLRRAGFVTFSDLQRYLKIPLQDKRVLHAHCRALGIKLERFKRDEKYVKKQYKKHWRPFTEEEARRIMERHYGLIGRQLEYE